MQNYVQQFSQNYAFIQENFDENSILSRDIWKFFEINFILAKGKFLKDKSEFVNAAKNYAFKHASPYDFKLNLSEKNAKLDVNKSLRMPLIYLCGGLDFEAVAYSGMKAFYQSIFKLHKNFSDKRLVLSIDEDLHSSFLNELLLSS